MLPYFRPPDVAGLHRCYFEFRSQEVLQLVDRYRGYKRYRFNKYVPISERFPEPTVNGLVFGISSSVTERLIGMQTAWNLPAGCSLTFKFTNSTFTEQTLDGFAELGVGFRQFDSAWWWAVDALNFSCRRRTGTTNEVQYHTLRSTPILGSTHLSGIGTAFMITAKHTGTQLELHYTEYAADGITPVVSHVETQSIADPAEAYPVVMYCRGVGAVAQYELSQTEIVKFIVPNDLTISPIEQIYFYENPSEYTLPIGPLQAPALDIYSQPHVAYIEDGTIQLSAPAAPQGWVNLLYFLLDSTVEPMVFSDITGAKWLTCFQEVTGKGRKVQGKTASGYELRLPVLVVH